jgi:hypothetical protein
MATGGLMRLRRAKATVLQGFWHGPPLGPVREACLRSFVDHGYRFHLYTYDAVDVPDGITVMDADPVLPRAEMFHFENPFTGRPDLGPFSDVFRFRLLATSGGWWSDVDTVSLSPDLPEVETAWAQENPEAAPRAVGTSQIALRAGSDLALRLDAECFALSRSPLEFREVLGPKLLSRVIEESGLPPSNFGTADTFYPVRWIEAFKLWLPQYSDEITKKTASAMFLPVYQSFPQYLGLDVGKLPPTGSYLAGLCERFGTTERDAPRHEVDDVIAGVREFFSTHEWARQELETVSGSATLSTIGIT